MYKNVSTVLLSLLLSATVALAQSSGSDQSTSPSAAPSASQDQTTTTTTTTHTTTTGTSRSVEGCIVKEGSDFFLIPRAGSPIRLQPSAGQDLSEHVGHKVKAQGTLGPIAASSATASSSGAQSTASTSVQTAQTAGDKSETATGTGNDLHKLADRQLAIDSVTHISASCPVNWNPKFPASKQQQ